MARLYILVFALGLLVSCGGSGDRLGTVAGEPVTVQDFLETFRGLPPDRQVAVLEPGGRMALMQGITTKRLLLAAADASPASDTDFWVRLYSSAWLSDSLIRSMAVSFDPEPVLAGLDSCIHTIRVVLLPDSLSAVETARIWSASGPSDPGGSLTAPWSAGSGTGYRVMSGPPWYFPAGLVPLLTGSEVMVLPMYGGWLVGVSERTEAAAVPDQNAGMSLFGWEVERAASVTISAEHVRLLDADPAASRGSDAVLAIWEGGELTVSQMSEILDKVSPLSFPHGIPAELSAFTMPEGPSDRLTALWFVVSSTSRTLALADLAGRAGGSAPVSTGDYARTEALVRERVVVPSTPDSARVQAFYEENIHNYTLPERRSVLLGYVEAHRIPGLQGATGFGDLGEYQTMADSSGNPVPTPLQPRSALGEALGAAVFAAEPGSFQGPVEVGGGLAAYFQVVAAVPQAPVPLHDVFPLVEMELFQNSFDVSFSEFIDSLSLELGVEIDTAAVQRVDPWAAVPRR